MAMTSILLLLAALGVCGLMLWGSYKIEPHWVSKDGQRFVCYGQGISNRGESYGRWRELRVTKMRDGTVELRPRHGSLVKDRHAAGMSSARTTPMARVVKRQSQRITYWKVNGASPDPPPRRIVYFLTGNDDPTMPEMLALRLPLKSRAIPMLESLATNKSKYVSELLSSARNQGTTQSEEQPDQD